MNPLPGIGAVVLIYIAAMAVLRAYLAERKIKKLPKNIRELYF